MSKLLFAPQDQKSVIQPERSRSAFAFVSSFSSGASIVRYDERINPQPAMGLIGTIAGAMSVDAIVHEGRFKDTRTFDSGILIDVAPITDTTPLPAELAGIVAGRKGFFLSTTDADSDKVLAGIAQTHGGVLISKPGNSAIVLDDLSSKETESEFHRPATTPVDASIALSLTTPIQGRSTPSLDVLAAMVDALAPQGFTHVGLKESLATNTATNEIVSKSFHLTITPTYGQRTSFLVTQEGDFLKTTVAMNNPMHWRSLADIAPLLGGDLCLCDTDPTRVDGFGFGRIVPVQPNPALQLGLAPVKADMIGHFAKEGVVNVLGKSSESARYLAQQVEASAKADVIDNFVEEARALKAAMIQSNEQAQEQGQEKDTAHDIGLWA